MRYTRFFRVLILFGISFNLLQASTPSDSFYTAGVVEFEPARNRGSSLNQLNNNSRDYIAIIKSNEAARLDIIVFPELCLNNVQYLTYVPDPRDHIIPCNNATYETFLQDISCTARNARKYVVVNLLEKEDCNAASQMEKNDPRPCAENGLNNFNTNVAFDRNGAVIARYRKYNSYDLSTNITYLPELSTFKTDFGVTFGMFICFDMNFYEPARKLVELGIKDFVYSSFWFSELPFLTAVQLQQSWAYANNVNLLAAGASNPSGGTTGSGIYAGKQGALVSVMAQSPERKLYIANVTKRSEWTKNETSIPKSDKESLKKKSIAGIYLMREYRMEAFTSELLEITDNSTIDKNLCHGSFCCQFHLEVERNPPELGTSSYKYHLAVFDGDRKYSGFGYTKYKFCAIYACAGETLDSCGRVFDERTKISPELVFRSISIVGDFPDADKVLIMPNSLDQNLMPLTTDRFEFDIEKKNEIQRVIYTLSDEADDLLTFAIYANYYSG